MVGEREAIRDYVSRITGGKPVCWLDERISKGDFEGRDWTLEIFDVPHQEQRALHARLWSLNRRVWQALHQSLTLVFHTPEETTRLYSWARQERPSGLLDSTKPRTSAPLPASLTGYCFRCHQERTLRSEGTGHRCVSCGNEQQTDGLWVASLQ
uniref:Uncharacterized protein n=1 Tax=Pyxidicoccus sp. TaxID=2023737 RepID=A0A3S7UYZ1_9BACT|nr:hypothetical protein [Pyxidicoccus sp.]